MPQTGAQDQRPRGERISEQWYPSVSYTHLDVYKRQGETYQLKETIAPDGYAVTDTITLTVQDTSEIQQAVMKDELTHIQVLKVAEEGDPFAGNELAIVDADGNIVEQWTSTEEAHDVYGLTGGETYILKELRPAAGYTLSLIHI